MGESNNHRVCPRDGCNFPESGKCLEGHDPPKCPYLAQAEESLEEGDTPTEPDVDAAKNGEWVRLANGNELRPGDVDRIARAHPTKLIVLAGVANSGKTTLITSVYEKLCEAPFSGYSFAGSETLRALEKRCYLGRQASERVLPDTPRTSLRRGTQFIHLMLKRQSHLGCFSNLLFVDVSGETFKQARNSSSKMQELKYLRRADHFSVLMDGELLSKKARRQKAFNDGRSIVKSVLQEKMLRDGCDVQILFTKEDLWRSSRDDQAETSQFLEYVQSEMIREFCESLPSLHFAAIAARPISQGLPYAHGVATLLKRWADYARMKESTGFPKDRGAKAARESLAFSDRFFAMEAKSG